MRPDEHKKKSSAKYKKKHGIQVNDNATTKKTDLLQDNDEKVITNKISNVQDGSSKLNSNMDSISHGAVGKKSYSKRALVNNWDKYEEEDEKEVEIGADFKELLTSAGGASSHMVLKSEKSWDLDQDMDEILSIDFQKLADSLSKLPFCERLGLDESQFDPSLLELLNGNQESNEAKSNAAPLHSFSFRDYNFDFCNPRNEKDFHGAKDSLTLIEDTVTLDSAVLHVEDADKGRDLSEQISTKRKQSVDSKSINSVFAMQKGVKRECEESSSSTNESTDISSISFSNPTTSKPTPQVTFATPKSIATEDLETELDDLLSGTMTVSTSQSSEVKQKRNIGSNTGAVVPDTKGLEDKSIKEQDDLEEWLDSII